MKKKFLLLMTLLCCVIIANAVPAKRGSQTIKQSDGTILTVHAVGNAFNHAILTDDGLMVARGTDGDFYYYSSLTGLTAVRAHDKGHRTASEEAFVSAQSSNLTVSGKTTLRMNKGATFKVGGSNADASVPAQGQRKIPIILVQFKDKYFNNTREAIINAMLMGNSSVGQYFRDQSNGLYQPDFDVYGIYTLSQNREYYGGHSGNDSDKGLGYLVTEACQKASADGASFKPYDTNNDDYCDVVIVIYAGVGEAQAWWNHPEAIWPCNWNLSSAAYYGQGGNGAFRPKYNDPLVNNFAVFNELNGSNDDATTIDGIGTFAHEFGHCLGLPDFYDTSNDNVDHHGMGSWDIMCNGCYNNNGYTPSGYTAYEKVFMGWLNYITPVPGTYYTLPAMNQKSAETDQTLCIKSDLNSNEYFIIEYKRRIGWDSYNPGEGIMITHVTFNEERWWYNSPNTDDIQLMTLMNADNSWSYNDEGTDLWPRNNKNAFTDNSIPAAKLNMKANGMITGNAGYLGKPVTGMVINPDGTASFWYMKYYNPVMLPVDETSINLTRFRADWTDQTSDEDVASYTLEVSTKSSEPELLASFDGTVYTGEYVGITLPEPWGSVNVLGGNNAIYISGGGKITFPIPQGYNNATFTLSLTTTSGYYGEGNFTVATPQTAAVEHYFSRGETYSWVVTASAGEMITITSNDPNYSPDIALLEVYAGDATKTGMRAEESGDATYRLITGITDKFYTVKNLTPGETFVYKVKAVYVDGFESAWSNRQEVTLFDNGHGFDAGDVNHDEHLNITDVTVLINYLLTDDDSNCCLICADVNNDNFVNISDVTELINILLTR